MIEVNFSISETVLYWLIFAGCAFMYTIFGAVTMAVHRRFRPGNDPDDEFFSLICGIFWPLAIAAAVAVGALVVLWNTLMLPARWVYKLVLKGTKND